jgi:CRISPR-associated protein Csx10
MEHLQIEIEALSPLAFPERKPGVQFRQSLGYVPGAVIYGALGARLKDHAEHANLFARIRCQNAYPMHRDANIHDTWVRPAPLTAIQPKGEDKRVRDALVERVCWEEQQPAALLFDPTDDEGRPWQAADGGFYTIRDKYGFQRRSVTQRVLTRVGINRQRRTAEDARLYSPLVINEVTRDADTGYCQPTRFLGRVVVPCEYADDVQKELENITHLGGRQTTGLGCVYISVTRANVDSVADILRRITTLTDRFREQADIYTALGGKRWEIPSTSIFTVNLLSDAILLEQGWIPTQQLSPEALEAATDIQAKLVRTFTNTRIVGGWNVTWQRPKPTALATMMGSVFVFQAAQSLDDEAAARLARLQWEGIGERRAEGYGQVVICDAFHTIQENTKEYQG